MADGAGKYDEAELEQIRQVLLELNKQIQWRGKPGIVVLCVEGGIGSGKSTFIEDLQYMFALLSKDLGFEMMTCIEPLDRWQKHIVAEGGLSLGKGHLDFFYEDMKKRALPFQVVAISSRLKVFHDYYRDAQRLVNEGVNVVLVTERSNISDQLFALCNYESGNMDAVEYDAYKYFVRNALRVDEQPISCHIYIRPDLTQCIAWKTKRGRECESDIPIDYLTMLEKKHDEAFVNNNENAVVLYFNEDLDVKERRVRSMKEMLRAVQRVVSPVQACECCKDSARCPELLKLERYTHKEEILRRSVDT